ncbi:MAG: hypothetical protein Q7S92_02215 [Candidatus Diapherotrites archaeon]|nr:hypothetical protein [Candidatus Diapherotrites archaeon]
MFKPKPKIRLLGGRKKITGNTGVQKKMLDLGGDDGTIFEFTYSKGKHTIHLAEKEYRTYYPFTNARRDFQMVKALQTFLPKKLFLPTVRLKLEKGKRPSLIMTQLGRNGNQVLDLWKVRYSEVLGQVKNRKALFTEMETVMETAKAHGFILPFNAFMADWNPSTGYGKLYIVDLGSIRKIQSKK